MNRVLIWDYMGISSQWFDQVADKKDIEIVATITPSEPAPKILLETDKWDWLLIFERGTRGFFNATIQILNLPINKVIYAPDINSWLQRPKAIYNILSMAGGGGNPSLAYL